MKALNKIVEWVLIIIFMIMTFSVIWQVLSRYIFNSSASFTEELSRYCLMWLAILGAAYMTGQKEHISIDFLFNKLSAKAQVQVDYFIELLIIAFTLAVLIIGGGYLVYTTLILNQTSPALGIPLGYVYSILPISGLLMVVYTIKNMIELKQKSYDA